jgi:hypothetical protein
MDNKGLLAELLDLAEQIGIEVRQVYLGGEGGSLCRLRGKWVLFVDAGADMADQVASAAAALAGRQELNDRYIKPQVRELLEQAEGSDPQA